MSTDIPETETMPEKRLFMRYRPEDRRSKAPILKTRQTGWLVVLLILFLNWAAWPEWSPARYAMWGVSFGLLMMLRGALDLTKPRMRKTALGRRLMASRDRWFPLMLFFIQNIYLFLIVSVLWFSMVALGLTVHIWVHINLYILLSLLTVRRLLSEWAGLQDSSIRTPIQDGLQFLTGIVITLLLATALTHFFAPFGHPITGDNSLPLIFVWVIAVLIVLFYIILLIDRIMGKKGR